jgi:hypothetical protein
MRSGVKRDVLLLATGIFLALLPLQLGHADQAAGKIPPADVLFAVFPAQSAAQAFVPVVVQAIRYKLTERGLVVLSADDAKDPAQINTQARKEGVPIVLSCGISASDTRLLAISLEWRDLQKPSPPVRKDNSGPLDITLDSVILQALDSLIGEVSQRVDELVAARATAASTSAAAAGPAAGTGTTTATGGQPAGGTGTAAAPALPPAGGAAGQTPPSAVTGPPAVAGRPYFALDTGVAPFVPVGVASQYFPVGVLPVVGARIVFPTPSGRIAFGLYAAAIYFMAEGNIDTSQNLLVPVGVDVRYEIGNGAPFLLFTHLSGGPAMLVIASSSQGTLTDLTAYFKAGLGATFMFNPRLGLSFAADYEVYFEMPYLIMGFTPWVAMSFKL